MGKKITKNFNVHNAKQFVESLDETANSIYYVFASRHVPWTGDGVSDLVPPVPSDSIYETFYDLYDNMIFGKKVNVTDIKHMINNYQWTSGTIYAQYDDLDKTLPSKRYYVIVPESGSYSVFKCLSNNKGVPSTSAPSITETSADDEVYITTGDGYQWKYMYQISASIYNKFATADKIPVVPDANVVANAVSGAIDFVEVEEGGSRYFSVANGIIAVANVAGNTRIHELESLVSANLTISNTAGTFSVERADLLGRWSNGDLYNSNNDPNTANNIANGIILEANSTFLRISDIAGNFFGQTGNVVVKGASSNAQAQISSFTSTTSSLSSNTDFYKGSTLYISAGAGAGQSKNISEYVVTGSARRVVLSSDFDQPIDSTSRFEIGPRLSIVGDGTGVEAIATVNTVTYAVDKIQVVNRGSGYSWAKATVFGNTGIVQDGETQQANNAIVRVIIGPKGGHGADAVSELAATTVGISVDFANTENGNISVDNDFRQFGILKDPLFANVSLAVSNVLSNSGVTGSGTSYSIGDTLFQAKTYDRVGIPTANVTLSNTSGTFEVEKIRFCGKWSNGDLYAANGDPNTSNNFANAVVIEANSTVLQIVNMGSDYNIYQTNTVILGVESSATAQIGSITANTPNIEVQGAYGTLTKRETGVVYLSNVYGQFVSSGANTELKLSDSANTTATIGQILTNPGRLNSNFNSFDQRLILTGFTYSALVYQFQEDEVVVQDETDAEATIQYINSSTGIVALTNVKGNWMVSDTVVGDFKRFRGKTSEAVGYFTGKIEKDIVDYSGEVFYVENLQPVTRDNEQTERIKLMIEF